MGPKPQSPKKGKKSKAELEEERQQRLLLEQQQAALAEQQRIQNEKQDAEKKKQFERLSKEYRENILKYWNEKVSKVNNLEKAFQERLSKEKEIEAKNSEWKNYLNPSDSPDPWSESLMNTFLSQSHELTYGDPSNTPSFANSNIVSTVSTYFNTYSNASLLQNRPISSTSSSTSSTTSSAPTSTSTFVNSIIDIDYYSSQKPLPSASPVPKINSPTFSHSSIISADPNEVLNHIYSLINMAYLCENVYSTSLAKDSIKSKINSCQNLALIHDLIWEKFDLLTIKFLRYPEKYYHFKLDNLVEEKTSYEDEQNVVKKNKKFLLNNNSNQENQEVHLESCIISDDPFYLPANYSTLLPNIPNHVSDKSSSTSSLTTACGLWCSFSEHRLSRKVLIFPYCGIELVLPKQLLQQNDRYAFRVVRIPIVMFNYRLFDGSYDDNMIEDIQNELEGIENESELFEEKKEEISEEKIDEAAEKNPDEEKDQTTTEDNNEEKLTSAPPSASFTSANKNNAKLTQLLEQLQKKYIVLGDLYHFDILLPPSNPNIISSRKWIVRDNSPAIAHSLRRVGYPSTASVLVTIRLDATIDLSNPDIRVVLWNEQEQEWISSSASSGTNEYISGFQISKETRMVKFSLSNVGIFALVIPRIMELPLKKWALFPVNRSPITRFDEEIDSKNIMDGLLDDNKLIFDKDQPKVIEGSDKPKKNEDEMVQEVNEYTLDDPDKTEDTEPKQDNNLQLDAYGRLLDEKSSFFMSIVPQHCSNLIKPPLKFIEKYLEYKEGYVSSTNTSINNLNYPSLLNYFYSTYEGQHVRLYLETQTHNIVIDVINTYCYLLEPNTEIFADLIGQPLNPGQLIFLLIKRGICLISPSESELNNVIKTKLLLDYNESAYNNVRKFIKKLPTNSGIKLKSFEDFICYEVSKICNSFDIKSINGYDALMASTTSSSLATFTNVVPTVTPPPSLTATANLGATAPAPTAASIAATTYTNPLVNPPNVAEEIEKYLDKNVHEYNKSIHNPISSNQICFEIRESTVYNPSALQYNYETVLCEKDYISSNFMENQTLGKCPSTQEVVFKKVVGYGKQGLIMNELNSDNLNPSDSLYQEPPLNFFANFANTKEKNKDRLSLQSVDNLENYYHEELIDKIIKRILTPPPPPPKGKNAAALLAAQQAAAEEEEKIYNSQRFTDRFGQAIRELTLLDCFCEDISSISVSRALNSNATFSETVYQLLKLLRIFSLS